MKEKKKKPKDRRGKTKGFMAWFKSGAKIKRWIFLILVGIALACYGFAETLVLETLTFGEIAKIVLKNMINNICYIINNIQKKNIKNYKI